MPLQTKPQKGRPKGKQDRQCSQREAAIALKRTRARINAMQQITRKAAKAAAAVASKAAAASTAGQ